MLFKGEVQISHCHSLKDFRMTYVFYCYCYLLINCSTSGKKNFYLCYVCVSQIEVTQDITTGVIPLEAVRTTLPKRPHRRRGITTGLFSVRCLRLQGVTQYVTAVCSSALMDPLLLFFPGAGGSQVSLLGGYVVW